MIDRAEPVFHSNGDGCLRRLVTVTAGWPAINVVTGEREPPAPLKDAGANISPTRNTKLAFRVRRRGNTSAYLLILSLLAAFHGAARCSVLMVMT